MLYKCRAFSSSLLCDNGTQSPAVFQNIKCCIFLPKFSNILPFLPPFLPFFWKIAPMPLISRIGPKIWLQVLHLFYRVVIRSDGEKLRNKVIKNNSIGLKLNLPTKNLPKNIYFFGPVWTVFVESRLNFRVLYLKSFTFALYYLFERPAKLLI